MSIAAALGKLVGNVSQTLMWFFALPLFIGIYKWFGKRKWHEPEKFFIIVFVAVNILAVIWLYCKFGYMSDRHILPLMMVLVLFVPAGIQEWALWLERKFSNKVDPSAAASHNQRLYFLVLLIIGFCICVPKLLKPIRIEEQGYRAAADWLKANTKSTDVIAVPDKRINFYAERTGLVYVKGNIPARAAYVVKEIEANAAKESTENLDKAEYQYVDKRNKRVNITIYRNF
jgi:hypothetical protein